MSIRNYGIVGGGLAGLSTAYHLLEKSPSANITIFDNGNGGASLVAGGLLHPLSPKGKLDYKGFEGLASANKLIQAASQFENNVVLRKKIYRIAMTEANVVQYQKTADELPELATWIEPGSTANSTGNDDDKEDWEENYFRSEKNVLGALRLSGSCKVLHMESYLKGLWSYCQSIGTGSKKWIIHDDDDDDATSIDSSKWKERLADFDCVIWCCGSALFHSSFMDQDDFPIQLVRGQSIEMTMNDDAVRNAVLCGKYVSPMLGNDRVLIGATHEYKEEPLKPSEVEAELKERSYDFTSEIWDNGTIEKVTTGYRVQSNRGPYGRLPIVGKLNNYYHHHNSWIFTGLSGRGILYHGIYGDLLSDLILGKTNEDSDHLKNMDWWRK